MLCQIAIQACLADGRRPSRNCAAPQHSGNVEARNAALTAPTYDVSPVEAIGGAVLGALALIWVIRQAINLAR